MKGRYMNHSQNHSHQDAQKTRAELLADLASWRSLENPSSQEDFDYANQRIRELLAAIKRMDKVNPPGHRCRFCMRTDEGNECFLGFHQFLGDYEVCDDCAWERGCDCCDTPPIEEYEYRIRARSQQEDWE